MQFFAAGEIVICGCVFVCESMHIDNNFSFQHNCSKLVAFRSLALGADWRVRSTALTFSLSFSPLRIAGQACEVNSSYYFGVMQKANLNACESTYERISFTAHTYQYTTEKLRFSILVDDVILGIILLKNGAIISRPLELVRDIQHRKKVTVR